MTKPITAEHIRSTKELEEKRKELLEEAKSLKKIKESMEKDAKEMAEELASIKKMGKEYETLLKEVKAKAKALSHINDPAVVRHMDFASAKKMNQPEAQRPVSTVPYLDQAGRQVMPMPVDNIAVAKTLLEQDRSPEAVAQVYDLCAKALEQQEKVTSS